jgi:hypothetical protein
MRKLRNQQLRRISSRNQGENNLQDMTTKHEPADPCREALEGIVARCMDDEHMHSVEAHRDWIKKQITPAFLALDAIVKTADSGQETGHTEAETVAGNWDVLGPQARAALKLAKGEAN